MDDTDSTNWDESRIDDAVLGLLYLTSFDDGGSLRTWKGHSWKVLDRLHEAGLISNPKGKAKSVAFTDEGWVKCREKFAKQFTTPSDQDPVR